jgi:hypothetical protein
MGQSIMLLIAALSIAAATPALRVAVAAGEDSFIPGVQRWGQFELKLVGPEDGNPFLTELSATFQLSSNTELSQQHTSYDKPLPSITVAGFYDGGGVYLIRFSPPEVGVWEYKTSSPVSALDGKSGKVTVTNASGTNHGPIESRGYSLYYADGTPHFSSGTTCYQWASKGFVMQQQTLATLRNGSNAPLFNKIRMTVFPKWYVYNHANPVETGTVYDIKPGSVAANSTAWGCEGGNCPSTNGSFDLRRFNTSFWQVQSRVLLAGAV